MRVGIQNFQEMKRLGKKIAMLTAYDYTSARLIEEAEIPIILVGDSLGEWVLGYDSTLPVTMDEMIHHTKAVVRGTEKAHVVADMPFMSYQAGPVDSVRNAGRLLKEGGAQTVKLEGGRSVADLVRCISDVGIPVMGHIGMTPQSINQFGRPVVQGDSAKVAESLVQDAIVLEQAGAWSIVLELLPARLAKLITEKISIPTIGIGAGVYCDGQVQVLHDLLGLLAVGILTDHSPRHARRYAQLSEVIMSAVSEYAKDVNEGQFPSDKESFKIKRSVLDELISQTPKSA